MPYRVSRVKSCKVGSSVVADLVILVTPFLEVDDDTQSKADGYIGTSFLEHFIVTIDLCSQRLYLGSPGRSCQEGAAADADKRRR